MVTKFTQKQLLRLKLSTDKIKIILEFQEKLPILLEDNNSWIDARTLWEHLCVKDMYTKWIKKQIDDADLIENDDYRFLGSKQKTSKLGGRPTMDIEITVDAAKSIAMIAGVKGGRTSKVLKHLSKVARHYFIYMEEALKENFDFNEIRVDERQGFNIMCDALDKYLQEKYNRSIDKWDRIYESNAINIIATGLEAKDIRSYIGCKDNQTREYLDKVYNGYINDLQEFNTQLITASTDKYQRYIMMYNYFQSKYPNAVLLTDSIDIKQINENRKKLLEEVYEKTQRVA